MYFLINELDNSVNCCSPEPMNPRMCGPGVKDVGDLPIDHMPPNYDLITALYDPVTNSIIEHPNNPVRLSDQEVADYYEQQKLISQAVNLSAQEKLNLLVKRMAELHPEDPVFAQIASDGVVTSEELKQIEDMLNGVK
jgi:hypothetical protein